MSDEIINRVANSSLEVVDLEELYVEGIRNLISIENFLEEGGVLVESKFREKLNSFNWSICIRKVPKIDFFTKRARF